MHMSISIQNNIEASIQNLDTQVNQLENLMPTPKLIQKSNIVMLLLLGSIRGVNTRKHFTLWGFYLRATHICETQTIY